MSQTYTSNRLDIYASWCNIVVRIRSKFKSRCDDSSLEPWFAVSVCVGRNLVNFLKLRWLLHSFWGFFLEIPETTESAEMEVWPHGRSTRSSMTHGVTFGPVEPYINSSRTSILSTKGRSRIALKTRISELKSSESWTETPNREKSFFFGARHFLVSLWWYILTLGKWYQKLGPNEK